jgi:hypothetical protein
MLYIIFYILYIKYIIHIYQDKRTPLHLAALCGYGKIVETLVEAKADPCAQDRVSVLKETRLDADRAMR